MSVQMQENDSPAVKGLVKEYEDTAVNSVDKETGLLKDASAVKTLADIKDKIEKQREFEAMVSKDISKDAPNPTDDPDPIKTKANPSGGILTKVSNELADFHTKNLKGYHEIQTDVMGKALFDNVPTVNDSGIDPYGDDRREVIRDLYDVISLVDIVPVYPTNSDLVRYYEQTARTKTTRTNQDREPGEVIHETAFRYDQKTVDIENFAVGVPVTRESMQDSGFIRALITEDLRRDMRDALETELYGKIVAAGPTTDSTALASVKAALAKVSEGIANIEKYQGLQVNFIAMKPATWGRIMGRAQTAANAFGGPGVVDVMRRRLFGIPVIISEKIQDNYIVIGESRGARIFDRQQTRLYTEPRYAILTEASQSFTSAQAFQTVPTHSDWLYVAARNATVRVRNASFYIITNATTTTE